MQHVSVLRPCAHGDVNIHVDPYMFEPFVIRCFGASSAFQGFLGEETSVWDVPPKPPAAGRLRGRLTAETETETETETSRSSGGDAGVAFDRVMLVQLRR